MWLSVLKLLLTLRFCTEKLKVFVEMSSLFIELEIQSVVLLFMKKISVLYVCVYGCFSCYSRLMILVLLYLFLLVQYQISFLKLGDYK